MARNAPAVASSRESPAQSSERTGAGIVRQAQDPPRFKFDQRDAAMGEAGREGAAVRRPCQRLGRREIEAEARGTIVFGRLHGDAPTEAERDVAGVG